MKKIILDLATTLDGYIEGPNGEVDWCIMENDMNFDGFLSSIDTIFYGRVSYDAWGNYTPDEKTSEVDLKLWKGIHSKNLTTGNYSLVRAGRIGMSAMLLFTSLGHFLYAKGISMMMPEFVPKKQLGYKLPLMAADYLPKYEKWKDFVMLK